MNKYTPTWDALVQTARGRDMSAYRLGEIGRGILAHEDELQHLQAEVGRLRTEITNVISVLQEDQHSQALAALLRAVVDGSTHADT